MIHNGRVIYCPIKNKFYVVSGAKVETTRGLQRPLGEEDEGIQTLEERIPDAIPLHFHYYRAYHKWMDEDPNHKKLNIRYFVENGIACPIGKCEIPALGRHALYQLMIKHIEVNKNETNPNCFDIGGYGAVIRELDKQGFKIVPKES